VPPSGKHLVLLVRGELLRRMLNLLNSVTADDMANSVRFLEEFR